MNAIFQSNGCWDFRLLFGAGNTIITVVVFNHAIRKRCNKHAPIKDDLFTRWPPTLSKIKIKRPNCCCSLTMTWWSLTHGALLSGAVWGCFAWKSDLDEAVKKRLRSGESPRCELAPDPLRGLLGEDEGSAAKEMELVNWAEVKRAGKDKSALEEPTPLGNCHHQQPSGNLLPSPSSSLIKDIKLGKSLSFRYFPPQWIYNRLTLKRCDSNTNNKKGFPEHWSSDSLMFFNILLAGKKKAFLAKHFSSFLWRKMLLINSRLFYNCIIILNFYRNEIEAQSRFTRLLLSLLFPYFTVQWPHRRGEVFSDSSLVAASPPEKHFHPRTRRSFSPV